MAASYVLPFILVMDNLKSQKCYGLKSCVFCMSLNHLVLKLDCLWMQIEGWMQKGSICFF